MLRPTDPALADSSRYGEGLFSHADWCGAFRTAEVSDWLECEMEGELPVDLEGTLYRNGPGRFERGGVAYRHFLEGDGFVHAWEFSQGRARYKGDYVATSEYAAEEAADEVLFRGIFGTPKPGGLAANALDIRMKNLANTNVVEWGGRLLALYEASHPCRLEPATLRFLGGDDLGGVLRPGLSASSGVPFVDGLLGMGGDAFTAHPKMDPQRRSLVGFSWASKDQGIELRVHEWDEAFVPRQDAPRGARLFLADCDAQPHDFGLTGRRYVFIENRLRMANIADYILGFKGAVECLEAQPELRQRIHVLPREGGSPVTVEGACSAFDVHVAHCHDGPPIGWSGGAEGDCDPEDLVTLYTSGWDELPAGPFLGSWGSEKQAWPFELPPNAPGADFNEVPRARLLRHVVDARRGRLIERRAAPGCEELCMEHPMINCSYTGNPRCRYVYMVACNECGLSTPPCGWARADLLTGEVQRWYAGSRTVAEEPHFVPRRGPRGSWTPGDPEGAEDDGWLLGVLYDAATERSCLCVFDAARLEDGPVCRLWLPRPLPHGLHGCFVPGSA